MRPYSNYGEVRRILTLGLLIIAAIQLQGFIPANAESPKAEDPNPPNSDLKEKPALTAIPSDLVSKPVTDLSQMSLESLTGLNVMVTSSAKKSESLRDATSAIYVITSEDIQRSGFTHLADLFRMVPGMQVARQDASNWAIGTRGFNAPFNNMMLILVDGRSVYDPSIGGTIWKELDLLLDDIDHIEVIRGPGGTLWGANAVNGVINIITKDSKVTQGLYATALGGNLQRGMGSARYGGKIGDDLYYRIYAKTDYVGSSEIPGTGASNNDEWNAQRAGFRADYHGERDTLTLQGDFQQGHFDYLETNFNPLNLQTLSNPNTKLDNDANILARWVHSFSDGSEIQLQANYDQVSIKTNDNQSQLRDVAGAQFQHRFNLNDWNEITWGGDFRNDSDQYNLIDTFYYPSQISQNTYSGFLQDKLTLVENHLTFTAGVKLESDYDAPNFMPSARLLFTPDKENSLWASVSRVVRVPDQFEESAYLYFYGFPSGPGGPSYGAVIPNPDLEEDDMVAYELGYRTDVTSHLSVDLATFYNRYYSVVTFSEAFNTLPSPVGGQIIDELVQYNTDGGSIYGVELSAKWEITDSLKASLAYSYQDYDQTMLRSSDAFVGAPPPHNLFNTRLSFDPAPQIQLNTGFYFTDKTFLPAAASSVGSTVTPEYVRWDLGATWKPSSNWEVSVWGQDLEGAHQETLVVTGASTATNVVPRVFGQITARY